MGARYLILLALGCGSPAAMVHRPANATAAVSQGVPARARYQYVLARMHLEAGAFAEARAALDVAALHDPNSAWIELARADVAVAEGDLGAEQRSLRAARAILPRDPEVAGRLGLALVRSGDAAEAEEPLRAALAEGAGDEIWAALASLLVRRDAPDARAIVSAWSARPLDDPGLRRERARLRLITGDPAGAVDDGGAALIAMPQDARLIEEFVTAVRLSARYRFGLSRLETAHRLAPGSEDLLLRTWHLAVEARDPLRAGEAVAALDQLQGGRDAQLMVWLADARSALGDADGALRALDAAALRTPPATDLPFHRARVMRAVGRSAEALRALRVPATGVQRLEAEALRARLLLDLGRGAEARRAIETALVYDPDDYTLLGALVAACAATGDRASMLAAIDRMATLSPGARARDRARALSSVGSVEEALAVLEAGAGEAETWVLGGQILSAHGRAADAVSWLQRGVDRFPEVSEVRVELGLAALASGDVPAATLAMREALRLDAGDARAARFMAREGGWRGSPERLLQARAWLEQALERRPADVELLDALAGVEMELEQPLRAAAAWEEALRYRPANRAFQEARERARSAAGG